MAAHLIENYRNIPGEHCGSTAMRNLIAHYCGLELSEAAVFGLGSGLDFVLLESDAYDPGVLMFGRSATMEADLADALGLNYTEQIEPDDAKAWQVVRAEVAAGRPTMLSGDALYLDYRDFKVHFPAHRFVLLGFDDDAGKAFVADRIEAATQACGYTALAASRNPKDFISTYNLWGKFHDGSVARSLREAFGIAIERTAQRMLGADENMSQAVMSAAAGTEVAAATGIAGLARLAEKLPDFLARASGRALARYAAACIETFGTGGGNFRLMYSAFLQQAYEAGYAGVTAPDVDAMRESARLWTALAEHLHIFAVDGTRSAAGTAAETADLVTAIRECEAALCARLLRRAGKPPSRRRRSPMPSDGR